MRRQVTLRHWGNIGDGARSEAAGIAAENSRYLERPFWDDNPSGYRGSDKIYIYARYWRGEWAGAKKSYIAVCTDRKPE